jgi:hypothetical protein
MIREMADYLSQKLRTEFIASFSILKAYTAWIKSSGESGMWNVLADRLRDTLQYVAEVEESSPRKSRLNWYIDDMDAAVGHRIMSWEKGSLADSGPRRVSQSIMLEVL